MSTPREDSSNNRDKNTHRLEEDEHEHDAVMPGFRFHPTEEELIEFYLRRKVEGKSFSVELITFLELYHYDPWELPGLAAKGEKEWYFYVPRDRKYRNGDRPNRVTISGYWKATGADRAITSENLRSIGVKKTLVFYSGKAPKGTRTGWIMNEYRLPPHETKRLHKAEISLCRVHKRAGVEDRPSLPRSLPSSKASRNQTLPAKPARVLQNPSVPQEISDLHKIVNGVSFSPPETSIFSGAAVPSNRHSYFPALPNQTQVAALAPPASSQLTFCDRLWEWNVVQEGDKDCSCLFK